MNIFIFVFRLEFDIPVTLHKALTASPPSYLRAHYRAFTYLDAVPLQWSTMSFTQWHFYFSSQSSAASFGHTGHAGHEVYQGHESNDRY